MRPLLLILLLCLPLPARAQQLIVSLTCNLDGAPAQMLLAVEYQAAFDPLFNFQGNISGLFPAGVTIYTAGQLQSASAAYTFRGENDFADFLDHGTGQTFRVQWVLDGPNNGLWMKVNPFGGTTTYFCQFQEAQRP